MTSFTREQLERFGLRPDTSLGQHFLADDNVLDRILELARVVPGEHIVEPGPGLGPLTRRLAAAGARVTAIEYDERMREPLEHAAEGYPNIRVIYGDAVQQGAWTLEHDPDALVSNLPYDVSVPIIATTLQRAPSVRRFCVMLQTEVAERLMASPGTRAYGSASVLVQAFCDQVGRHNVGRGAFMPPPNVDSRVLAFDRVREPLVDTPAFSRVVRQAFAHRRKTLRNNLVVPGLRGTERSNRREQLEAACHAAGVDAGARPEALTAVDYVQLYHALGAAEPTPVRIAAPAKVNRFLAVGAAQPDGFHPLVSLLQPMGWVDTIEVAPVANGQVDRVSVAGSELVDTLVTRALRVARSSIAAAAGLPALDVVIHKSVPAGAGLGGGSGDAAAVLRLIGEWTGATAAELAGVAAEIGSDTVAQLEPTATLVTGRGDHVSSPAVPPPPVWLLIVWPAEHASTAAVYAAFDELHPEGCPLPAVDGGSDLVPADREDVRNDLEAAACATSPACGQLLAALRRIEPDSFVSGSGAACAAPVDGPDDARLPELLTAVREVVPEANLRVVRSLG